jgi:hypothetical protein
MEMREKMETESNGSLSLSLSPSPISIPPVGIVGAGVGYVWGAARVKWGPCEVSTVTRNS